MAITLGSNIASLRAQRRLFDNSNGLSSVFERLASGQRINRASDDAAGLAIAESLNADRRVYAQGVRNLNDGISLLNVADGALNELSGITTRLIELTEQAANGVLGVAQRRSLNEEAQALKDEYFRIVQATEFNDRQLFTAGFGELSLQAGIGSNAVISSSLGGAVGTGEFTIANTFTNDDTNRVVSARLGDLNGDGNLDLVSMSSSATTVLLGTGTGSFGNALSFASGGEELALGDLNGDGALDIISVISSGEARIRFGNGDGSFGSEATFDTGLDDAGGLTVADLNGDGNQDLIVAGSDGLFSATSILIGNGSGSFTSSGTIGTTSKGSVSVTVGDVNNDGILDIATAGTGNSNGEVAINLGNGDGTFGPSTIYATEPTVSNDVQLADLNGDGFLDLVTAGGNISQTSGEVNVRLGDGTGSFGDATSFAMNGGGSNEVQLVDINGDAILDMISLGTDAGGFAGNIETRLGDGTGGFGDITRYLLNVGRSEGLAIGDVNNDGVVDLVGGSNSGEIDILLNDTVDGVGPLQDFSLETITDARQALPVFQRRLDQLAEQRGQIGAFQSRIEFGSRVLQATAENYAAAESQIRDADIAAETAELVRLQILQQATAAVLAQANQQPALALQLLGER